MHRTRIKICGISTVEAARCAAESGADAIGLVFVEKSPRCVSVETARQITQSLPPLVEPIALFMDADPRHVIETCTLAGIRTVQLHGKESPDAADALLPLRVIKAHPWDDAAPLPLLAEWMARPNLAGFLWDAPAHGEELPGGTGRTADWSNMDAKGAHAGVPFFLAGGLTPDNVAEAVRVVRPFAVDVSSGVESSRGVKDHRKIAAFCKAVHEADASLHPPRRS